MALIGGRRPDEPALPPPKELAKATLPELLAEGNARLREVSLTGDIELRLVNIKLVEMERTEAKAELRRRDEKIAALEKDVAWFKGQLEKLSTKIEVKFDEMPTPQPSEVYVDITLDPGVKARLLAPPPQENSGSKKGGQQPGLSKSPPQQPVQNGSGGSQ